MRLLTALVLLILSITAMGQTSAFLRFPSEGTREVWVQTGLPSSPPQTGIKTEKATADAPLGDAKATDALFIWDHQTGNLASKTVGDVRKLGTWNVQAGDYQDIAEVVVRIQSDGKPAPAANVQLNDGRRTQRRLLDPSSKGEVRFFAVKPGSLKVTVEYNSEGSAAKPVTQVLEAPIKRSEAVPTLTIALPESVSGAEAPSTSATPADGSPTATQPPPGNPIGTILAYLVALGAAIAVGYFAFTYFRNNSEVVESKLKQLGVDVPTPGDADANDEPLTPIPPAKPEPPAKIVLDDADPTPLTSSAVTVAAASSAISSGSPKLVDDNGDELLLEEGELIVGREVGLGLSLVGESTVSRRHASITKQGDSVVVRDLGSTNGTYVNGAKVESDTPLSSGDTVQFGAIRFRYQG